jgi:hypothetical protein
MPFYIRLGPHGLIIAIGAVLHTKLGRAIYRRRRYHFQQMRQNNPAIPEKNWFLDTPSNLTPSTKLVQIVRHNHRPGRFLASHKSQRKS